MKNPQTHYLVLGLMVLGVAAVVATGIWDSSWVASERLEAALTRSATHGRTAALALSMGLDAVTEDLQAAAVDPRAEEDVRRRYGASLFKHAGEEWGTAPGAVLVNVHNPKGDVRALVPRASLYKLLAPIEHPTRRVLVQDYDTRSWHRATGEPVQFPTLDSFPPERDSALLATVPSSLGLPNAQAVVGLAFAKSHELGTWRVAVVSSYQRERQWVYRSWLRTVLTALSTAAVIAVFGVMVLRSDRQRLKLTQALGEADAREREQAQLERESRTAALTTLAAGVVHELSTPLSVISGRTEQLLAQDPSDSSRRKLEAIASEAARIRDTIQRFLRLARGGEPVNEKVDASALAREVARLVAHRFEVAGSQLEVRVPSEPCTLRGDGRLLVHCVANLLVNACDATGKDGHVWLQVERKGERVLIRVEDDGPGIPEEIRHRVMEPFFTTKLGGVGHGVGLSLAREIARMHRGNLELSPRSPHGVIAFIDLPGESEVWK